MAPGGLAEKAPVLVKADAGEADKTLPFNSVRYLIVPYFHRLTVEIGFLFLLVWIKSEIPFTLPHLFFHLITTTTTKKSKMKI